MAGSLDEGEARRARVQRVEGTDRLLDEPRNQPKSTGRAMAALTTVCRLDERDGGGGG